MARDGAVYACQSCGAAQTKWAGQCPACGAWNTLVEELQARPPGAMTPSKASKVRGLAFEGLADQTQAPPRNREEEAAKAKLRSLARFGS